MLFELIVNYKLKIYCSFAYFHQSSVTLIEIQWATYMDQPISSPSSQVPRLFDRLPDWMCPRGVALIGTRLSTPYNCYISLGLFLWRRISHYIKLDQLFHLDYPLKSLYRSTTIHSKRFVLFLAIKQNHLFYDLFPLYSLSFTNSMHNILLWK